MRQVNGRSICGGCANSIEGNGQTVEQWIDMRERGLTRQTWEWERQKQREELDDLERADDRAYTRLIPRRYPS